MKVEARRRKPARIGAAAEVRLPGNSCDNALTAVVLLLVLRSVAGEDPSVQTCIRVRIRVKFVFAFCCVCTEQEAWESWRRSRAE